MIELKHLDFAYEKNHPILTDLSAKFGEAGSNVLVLGALVRGAAIHPPHDSSFTLLGSLLN